MGQPHDKSLNSQQQAAIRHNSGPLLIIAGAGTGKTTVISERIKHLIIKKDVPPQNILALTFTEKASREMEERVDIAMPYGYTQMWISTFHSFCERILRQDALHIGYDPGFSLMSQVDTISLVRKNLYKFDLNYFRPLGNPNKFIAGMLSHFARLQDEDIEPSQYMDWLNNKSPYSVKTSHGKQNSNVKDVKLTQPNKSQTQEEVMEQAKWNELSKAYNTYEEIKIEERVMDFGDVIAKTLKLFRDRPNILEMYRKQFAQILVDEFQDTNVAQYELIKLLAPPSQNPNITVVGDDSQSIYKFRGAAISNILHFMDDFPTSKTVVLTKNYRSTQVILDASYKLIQHNNPDTLEAKLGIDKNLKSIKSPKDSHKIEFIHTARGESEAEEVAKEIQKLIANSTLHMSKSNKPSAISYSDIAILVRANNHADAFINAFKIHGIPHRFLGPTYLFKEPEVNHLISYLKLLKDRLDDQAWYNVLTGPSLNIPFNDMTHVLAMAKKEKRFLNEIFEDLDNISNISGESKEIITKVKSWIMAHTNLIKDEYAGHILFLFLNESGLMQKLIEEGTHEAQGKAENIGKFFEKIRSYESANPQARIFDVIEWIDLSSELGESILSTSTDYDNEDCVNIMTVHSSKGLEFPVVFLVNLVADRFPSRNRSEQIPIPDELIKEYLPKGDHHIQEERRLFYVGITRAKDRLYFCASNFYGDGVREKKLSPFIFEALGDLAQETTNRSTNESENLKLPTYTISNKAENSQFSTLNSQFHLDYLSYSQIDCFDMCPMHYKLRYIIKLPSPPSASASFGISMHDTLKDMYLYAKSGNKVTEELVYELLSKNWRRDGYDSRDHLETTKDAGEKYLVTYLKNHFDTKLLPETLEQPFTLTLPAKKGERQLKIGGKIDRVDVFSDRRIEIIDYKTGSTVPSQKDVDRDMQLTFYALAATLIKEPPFGKQAEDITLTLYYFDGDQKISTTRTKEQLTEAIDKIYEIRKSIEESDFECNGNYFCESCEYKQFCKAER
jgi:DNA helicase II / ATP-dependent DNA helicase PcrA